MEKKLAEYRATKRSKGMASETRVPTSTASKFVDVSSSGKYNECSSSNGCTPLLPYQKLPLVNNAPNPTEEDRLRWSWLSVTLYILYILLWLTLYAIAIQLEFGAVYFVVSLFFILWANTRTGPKKKGEISAYSVFNPNCEAIDGTLKAEQFEQEIRFGAGSVR